MSELIDRQAFIEQERKLYCEDCDRRKGTKNGKPNVICYEIGEAPCRACWLDDAIGDLEDFPTASPWHRAEELPKEDGKYVAINVKTKWWYEASYENGNWKAVDLFGQRWVVIHPTHWMPIEPPKEEEHGN